MRELAGRRPVRDFFAERCGVTPAPPPFATTPRPPSDERTLAQTSPLSPDTSIVVEEENQDVPQYEVRRTARRQSLANPPVTASTYSERDEDGARQPCNGHHHEVGGVRTRSPVGPAARPVVRIRVEAEHVRGHQECERKIETRAQPGKRQPDW